MDDNNFDKVVKEKLDGYEDPYFDESALVDFRDKLAAVYTTPWYQQSYVHYSLVALVAAITAAIIFLSSPRETENSNLALIKKNQLRIDSLEMVIKTLTIEKKIAVDNQNAVAANRSRSSEANISSVSDTDQTGDNNPKEIKSKSIKRTGGTTIVSLGPVNKLPFDIYQALSRQGMLVDDNGLGYLVAPPRESVSYNSERGLLTIHDAYHSPAFGISALPEKEKQTTASTPVKKDNVISAETKDALEKHYSKGLGINIAPHADVTFGQFSKGKALVTPRVGLLAELVVSPRFSFELGVDYSTTSIDFDRDFQTIEIPNLDTSLGTINSAHIKNSLISTPLSIRYRKWISDKNQGFIRIGYTPYFTILQEYQCGYKPNYSHYPGQPYGNDVTSILQVDKSFLYGNTSSISLGFTRLMKKNDKIEGSLFYETSLSAVGNEKLAMTLFGIRTAYWFNFR